MARVTFLRLDERLKYFQRVLYLLVITCACGTVLSDSLYASSRNNFAVREIAAEKYFRSGLVLRIILRRLYYLERKFVIRWNCEIWKMQRYREHRILECEEYTRKFAKLGIKLVEN